MSRHPFFRTRTRYWIGVPPPPGAISASVGAVARLLKKIVPAALLAKLRLPVDPSVSGIEVV